MITVGLEGLAALAKFILCLIGPTGLLALIIWGVMKLFGNQNNK